MEELKKVTDAKRFLNRWDNNGPDYQRPKFLPEDNYFDSQSDQYGCISYLFRDGSKVNTTINGQFLSAQEADGSFIKRYE